MLISQMMLLFIMSKWGYGRDGGSPYGCKQRDKIGHASHETQTERVTRCTRTAILPELKTQQYGKQNRI